MTDPKKVLRFFEEHFSDIEKLVALNKKNSFVSYDDVVSVFSNSLVMDNLIEYKILEERFTGDYTFNEHYGEFISFLLDDFSLDMPEQIKKYYSSLSELYEKLKASQNKNETLKIVQALESEIFKFEKQLQQNIAKLIKETKEIKANNEALDYTKKLAKASELTTLYVEPLNTILEDHNESILYIIDAVLQRANLERFNHEDRNIKNAYLKLYNSYSHIKKEILKKNKLLIDEVVPLLDRIQVESRILTGFINFLGNNLAYDVPILLDRERHNTYAVDAHFDVKNIWEGHRDIGNEIIFDEIEALEDAWLYDKDKYYDLLLKSLPNDNFYEWIFNTLEEEFSEVEIKKFFDLSKLIFENGLDIEYENKKIVFELKDKIVTVPIVQIRSRT